MKKSITLSIPGAAALCRVLLLVIFFAGLLPASIPDVPSKQVVVRMRLYEGFRGESSGSGKVVSSYYLKPLTHENVFSDAEILKEKQTLKRVFNLTDIKLMTDAAVVLEKERDKPPFRVIVLNGRHLLVQLQPVIASGPGPSPGNRFAVEVLEDGKTTKENRSLLKSNIVLPEKKSTALGFEDSGGHIYFLSFHRMKDPPASPQPPLPPRPPKSKEAHAPVPPKPRLLHKVNPEYPKEAIKAGIQGRVVIEALTNEKGDVVEVKAVKGPKALWETAVNAVKQWKYEPYFLEGKAKPFKFTIVVVFNLDKGKKKEPTAISVKDRPKIIKKTEPQYPRNALKSRIQGNVVLEATVDTKGNVVDAFIIQGHPLLNDAAINAVKQWKYEPFVKDGVKKPVRFTVVIKFRLK